MLKWPLNYILSIQQILYTILCSFENYILPEPSNSVFGLAVYPLSLKSKCLKWINKCIRNKNFKNINWDKLCNIISKCCIATKYLK